MLRYIQFLVYLFLVVFSEIECAKILGVFQMAGTSHYLAYSTMMKILAEKGHDVTVVSAYREKSPPRNYKEVVLTGMSDKLKENIPNFYKISMNPWATQLNFTFFCTDLIEDVFNHTKFKAFMKSEEKFDAVIIEEFQSEALKYVAYHFKAPLIVFNPMDANEWVNQFQGNPDSPAHTPSLHIIEQSCNMSFFERVFNSVLYVYAYLIRNFIMIPVQNSLLHKYYPEAPHLKEIIYNVSLVLLNADSSVHEPLPKVPSMVNIGGFHIKKPEPLPKDLQELLDNSKHGVIYFSMGSTLKSEYMPEDKVKLLLETFSEFKETVLWKFDRKYLPEKSPNVAIRDWLPQNDILAHKNVKLFITHGGLFSTMEAVYHGVPILALPVFADQYVNAKRAAANGYAKYIPFKEIGVGNLNTAVNDMLGNQTYRDNVLRRSRIMTDQPTTPAESLNYWVEYVIRHQGAPHLRVAALNLAWYQRLLLDVVAFIGALLVVIVYCIRIICNFIFRKKNKKEKIN